MRGSTYPGGGTRPWCAYMRMVLFEDLMTCVKMCQSKENPNVWAPCSELKDLWHRCDHPGGKEYWWSYE